MLFALLHKLMQDERYLVWMQCAPGNEAFKLNGIVCYGADFHQLGFDYLRVSHSNTSMAHAGNNCGSKQASRPLERGRP